MAHLKKVISIISLCAILSLSMPVGAVTNCWECDHTERFSEWVDIGAKLMYAEASGVESQDEQAAVLWVAYNRVLDDRFPDDLTAVITAPGQFADLSHAYPDNDLYELSADVYRRFCAEQDGEEDVGRTIPSDYLFFHGDGYHNYFRKEYKSTENWDWSYPPVYGS